MTGPLGRILYLVRKRSTRHEGAGRQSAHPE